MNAAVPDIDNPDFQQFWKGCQERRLMVKRCSNCGRLFWPPRPVCKFCQSFSHVWVQMSGRGQVYSWVVVHRAAPLGFESRTPYTVAIVQLEDDPTVRFLGGVRNLGASSLEFGLAMEVEFVQDSHGLVLPYWAPAAIGIRID